MNDAVEFSLGQKVWHRTDDDQAAGIVTGIIFRPAGHAFEVAWGRCEVSEHYGFELSAQPVKFTDQ